MDEPDPPIRPSRRRTIAVGVSFTLFLITIIVWVFWSSGVYYRRLPTLSVAVQVPGAGFQVAAFKNGVHFICGPVPTSRPWGIHFGTHLSKRRYHHGYVGNILGFTIAILTHRYDGGDYSVRPHAAIAIPYWLLILVSGWGFLRFSGLGRRIRPFCRFSKLSWSLMGIAALVFLTLNCVPSASRHGGMVRPKSLDHRMNLMFTPTKYGEILLEYGYPFVSYRRGIIGGKSVEFFHGCGPLGWHQHLLMENICIGVAIVMLLGIAVEVARKRGRR